MEDLGPVGISNGSRRRDDEGRQHEELGREKESELGDDPIEKPVGIERAEAQIKQAAADPASRSWGGLA